MAAPYSYDLRQKAIEAVKRGERKSDVCRMLKLSRNTLDLWLKREEQTGDYRAITNFQKNSRELQSPGLDATFKLKLVCLF